MSRDTRRAVSKLSRKNVLPGGLHLVVFGAHPDDAELAAGGILAKLARQGYRVGIVDATRGEAGTRGTPEIRAREASRASRILGLAVRENLGLADGYVEANEESRRAVVQAIRSLRPEIVVVPNGASRHPDHRALFTLVRDACFLSGLRRWRAAGDPWKPRRLLFALAFQNVSPRFLVDISDVYDVKERAIRAYTSQIASIKGLGDVRAAGRPLLESVRIIHGYYGWLIGRRYAEPFTEPDGAEHIPLSTLFEG